MSAELDMSQYLDLFLTEAGEQLEILEQETLKLEADPSMERMQIIFRAAHTIKGSSRAMGFQNFASLTHEMENLLDQLRNGLIQVSTEIGDALLQCIDTLLQMTDAIGSGNGDSIECQPLVLALQNLVNGAGSTPAAPAAIKTASNTPEFTSEQLESLKLAHTTGALFSGTFEIDPSCAMKFVRAFMAISAIQAEGEIVLSLPNEEQIEAEEFDTTFHIYFQYNGDIEHLQKHLSEISEMKSAIVEAFDPNVDSEAPALPTQVFELPSQAPVSTPAVATPAVATDAKAEVKKTEPNQTVRVDVARLDNLMNLVGELVIDRTRISKIGADLAARYQDPNIDALADTVGHIARITGDLQDQIMKARMLAIETVFNRFPRVVRDLANKLEKDIKLELLGGETELDRSVIEVIGDPLLHLLRNCVDHGIELPDEREKLGKPRTGTVTVSARHQENHIVIEIVDDGKGIDTDRIRKKAVSSGLMTQDAVDRLSEKEALNLIFASGLSTAEQVSEVSGRGVGMDIVRSNITKLGGMIELETNVGKGSKFSLRLPLTLAIIRGLLVDVDNTVYVAPLGSVVETLFIEPSQIQKVNGKPVVVIRGMTTPLLNLSNVFGTSKNAVKEQTESAYVVIVGIAEQRVGFVVDKLVGEQEVVIKSLSGFCGDVPGISGATILGDGNVALIMDVNALVS